jgi:hypothetical protein
VSKFETEAGVAALCDRLGVLPVRKVGAHEQRYE